MDWFVDYVSQISNDSVVLPQVAADGVSLNCS